MANWKSGRERTQPENGEEEEHRAGIEGTGDFANEFVIPCHLCGHLSNFVVA
jgi:hypothetical protein